MTTQRRTFTASDLRTGLRVVLHGIGYAGVDLASGRLQPVARTEGTLEIAEGRVYLHTSTESIELPSDLNAIAARVVEVVLSDAERARLAECARRVELSKITKGLTHDHFFALLECDTNSTWCNGATWARRMVTLECKGLVRKDRAQPGFYIATELGREVNAMRNRGPMVAQKAVA